jgi:hypothetical protein
MILDKTCKTCKVAKPLSEFHKDARAKTKTTASCKKCTNTKKRDSYTKKEADKKRAYYLNNKEKATKKNKDYYENNKSMFLARDVERRARKLQASYVIDKRYVQDLFENSKEASLVFKDIGVTFHVDHIVPLKNNMVCGLHTEENLQILSAKENLEKSNKFLII